MSDPIDIANVEYDVEGPSVQTFESAYAKAMASIPEIALENKEERLEIESGSGSCSMQTSCSMPPRVGIAAIEVKVLENWGNPDFTCLYRVRVHGEPEKVE